MKKRLTLSPNRGILTSVFLGLVVHREVVLTPNLNPLKPGGNLKTLILLLASLFCGFVSDISIIHAQAPRLTAKSPACPKLIATCTSKAHEWRDAFRAARSKEQQMQLIEVQSAVAQGCQHCLQSLRWFNDSKGRWDGCGTDQSNICDNAMY